MAIFAVVGSYIGGSAAEGWEFNPGNWAWDGDTWKGIGLGAVIGAAGGIGFGYGAPALSKTGFFAHFQTSGMLAAHAITGAAAGGTVGYGAGFAGGMLYSDGNWGYSHQSGLFGAQLGATAGSMIGTVYGLLSPEGREWIVGMFSGPPAINSYEMDYGKTDEFELYNLSTENPSIRFDTHNSGASMSITYSYSGGQYYWFQTVNTNQPIGARSLNDVFFIDNGHSSTSPWYPPEYIHQGSLSQIILYDTPNRKSLLPNMYWEAESSLFRFKDDYYQRITTIRWGFYNSGGKAKGLYSRNAEPSEAHKNALLQWIKSIIW